MAGVYHVGIGPDFDGIRATPPDLEGVDRHPALRAERLRCGWTDEALERLAGGSVLRLLARAEPVAPA